MMVEESRMLQVSIFEGLQRNLHKVNFGILLSEVMVIANEVESYLAQAVESFISDAKKNHVEVLSLVREVKDVRFHLTLMRARIDRLDPAETLGGQAPFGCSS
jgi:hypothetical protein